MNSLLTTQFINYLSPNNLLSLYLTNKNIQHTLNNNVNKLNIIYGLNIKTILFTEWYSNYLLISPFIPEQLMYLYKLENTRYVDYEYNDDITEENIMELFDWLFMLRKKFKLSLLIPKYIPTFLYVLFTNINITKRNLKLYGCVCLYYCSLLFEMYPMKITDEFEKSVDFTADQLEDAIVETITLLHGQIIYPSPVFFIDNKDEMYPLVSNLALVSSMILPLSTYKPSLIAETCTYMVTGVRNIYSEQETAAVHGIIIDFLYKYQYTLLKQITPKISNALGSVWHMYINETKDNIIQPLKYHEPWHLGEFDELSVLGEGTFGLVKSVKRKQCGNKYAIKSTKLEDNDGEASLLEIGLLTLLKDQPKIIQLCGFEYLRDKISLILPLFDYSLKDKVFIGVDIWPYFRQIIEAVLECHQHDIVHRDIKVDNLVIKDDKIVLIDFGVCIPLDSFNTDIRDSTMANTSYYRPPECFAGENKYGKEIDIWAIGCVFYYMIMGNYIVNVSDEMTEDSILDDIFILLGTPTKESWPGWYDLPFVNNKVNKVFDFKIKYNMHPGKVQQLHKILAPYDKIVLDCLSMNPKNRPTAKELLLKYF